MSVCVLLYRWDVLYPLGTFLSWSSETKNFTWFFTIMFVSFDRNNLWGLSNRLLIRQFFSSYYSNYRSCGLEWFPAVWRFFFSSSWCSPLLGCDSCVTLLKSMGCSMGRSWLSTDSGVRIVGAILDRNSNNRFGHVFIVQLQKPQTFSLSLLVIHKVKSAACWCSNFLLNCSFKPNINRLKLHTLLFITT